jgi:hypothetical protein
MIGDSNVIDQLNTNFMFMKNEVDDIKEGMLILLEKISDIGKKIDSQ